jgi:hypothetical protein
MPDASGSGPGYRDHALLAGFLTLADAWIARTADDRGIAWFRNALDEVSRASGDRALGVAIGLAPRRVGKAGLALDAVDLARATALRNGLDPGGWSVDQLARIALMVASYRNDAGFAESLDRFCATAEINELIALCLGFAIYPVTAPIEPRAREAIRSGMKPVFEALAHRNPYPAEVFTEDHWNQMVVKAIFTGSSLWPIQGLDQRGNPRLASMMVALAQERWAAGRPISPEVWRCIAPHADADGLAAMARAWDADAGNDRLAIALALESAPKTSAGLPFGARLDEASAAIAANKIDWRVLAGAQT